MPIILGNNQRWIDLADVEVATWMSTPIPLFYKDVMKIKFLLS